MAASDKRQGNTSTDEVARHPYQELLVPKLAPTVGAPAVYTVHMLVLNGNPFSATTTHPEKKNDAV